MRRLTSRRGTVTCQGSLATVDGAVVLTDKLRIIGFGGEVRVSSPGTDTIHIAKNEEGDEITAAPFTGYGTRHRSAFHFVEKMDPSVAFILSQDRGYQGRYQSGPAGGDVAVFRGRLHDGTFRPSLGRSARNHAPRHFGGSGVFFQRSFCC